jgi:diguanylate cyclase
MLIEQNVAPSPLSYTVAYEYFSGSNKDLQQKMDEHLQAGKTLDQFQLRDFYDRYIVADHLKNLHGMGGNLQNLLNTLMNSIADAGEGASALNQNLEKNIDQLKQPVAAANLQTIAAEMLSATEAAQTRNKQLQQRLETTLDETDQLKAELEQYRREAQIDPLTGLYNRRAMDSHMEDLLATRAGDALSVVMLDIDHFKRINDTYGHALGDVVIRNVAETIRKCIRGEDFAVRFGGEEFLVLLPNTPLDGASKVAETIRSRIEALRLIRKRDNFTMSPFTISLGVATRRHDDTQDTLVERADRALYLSKESGRNRVTIESSLH